MITESQINSLAHSLIGTMDTLEDALEEIFNGEISLTDLNENDLKNLYAKVEICDICGWWVKKKEIEFVENKNIKACNDCRKS